MYDLIFKQLAKREKPIDVVVAGLGFMGFGFLSAVRQLPGMRVPLVVTRRPGNACEFLNGHGVSARIEHNPSAIKDWASRGVVCVSDDLNLIQSFENEVVIEMTGTVAYGTEVALATLSAGKHLVTMNPELQVTVGNELKALADERGVLVTDVIGDQPGSLSRLMHQAKLLGFKVRLAGNMKRFLNRHATTGEMKPWAEDKGLSVRQTVSFTDGTKQSIEMNLVANYFGMSVLQFGMHGPQVEEIHEALAKFPWDLVPEEGIVDYVIGKKLMPGVFIIGEHRDANQQKYLRYLNMGEGPRYVLFDSYHLCHLEVPLTIANVVLHRQETINNGTIPRTETIAVAKFDLASGKKLDGIGGDTVYGNIDKVQSAQGYLPIGFSDGATLTTAIHQDQPIKLSDVELPVNAATKLAGFVAQDSSQLQPAAQTPPHSLKQPPLSP